MLGYDVALVLLWTCLAALALAPSLQATGHRFSTPVFLTLLTLTVVFERLPTLSRASSLNQDEAQMTAQAIAFFHNPVPWLGFDGGTGGPPLSAFVALPYLAGLTPSFVASRFLGILLNAATVLALYALLRTLYGGASARLGVLLPATFYSLAVADDFVHYSSEQLPVFLFTVSLLALARLFASNAARLVWGFGAAGVAIGLLPFTKLQLVPLAAFAALLGLIVATRRPAARGRARAANVLALAAGLLAPAALFALLALCTGTLRDAFTSYVLFALAYRPFVYTILGSQPGLTITYANEPFFHAYLLSSAFVAAAAVAIGLAVRLDVRARERRRDTVLFGFAVLGTAAAAYAIVTPGTGFPHYALLAIVPLALVTGSLIGLVWPALRDAPLQARIASGALIAAASVAYLLSFPLRFGDPYLTERWPAKPSAPVEMVRRYVPPGASMALWGWMPQYAVAAGAVLGTRDAVTFGQIMPSPLQPYYRERYLRDVRERKPEFLLDTVAPGSFGYDDPALEGIETFSELARVVARDYRLVAEADGVRLFKRVK